MKIKNKCKRCEHIWIQRNQNKKSNCCPKCKRYDWDDDKNENNE